MSKTAKIMLIIFIIALAVVIYFIMFGKKNAATTTTTNIAASQPVANAIPFVREVVTVTDPSQRYIATGRPGVSATAN